MSRIQSVRDEVDRISKIIIEKCNPDKIILFGSLAAGKAGEYSDIDMLVVMYTEKRFIERLLYLAELTNPRVGIDFLVYTPDEFEEMLKHNNIFLREEVLKKGVVLYDRAVS